jgi:hypothetical protein
MLCRMMWGVVAMGTIVNRCETTEDWRRGSYPLNVMTMDSGVCKHLYRPIINW